MIQCLIVVINTGNIDEASERRPLTARSVALSTLLGTEPPVLPVGALVAVGELFGITAGTTRTALSRMVTNGELVADGSGRYRLVGRLLDRQAAQRSGRRPAPADWDGRWHWAVVVAEARSMARRRQFRGLMADWRFGELQPAVWLRPANLPAPAGPGPDVLLSTGDLRGGQPMALAGRLWDLDAWAAGARRLTAELDAAVPALAAGDDDQIPPTFVLSAAVLRHLRRDPLLPAELLPPRWPGDDLRRAYDVFDAEFGRRLRAFLAGQRPAVTNPVGDRSRR